MSAFEHWKSGHWLGRPVRRIESGYRPETLYLTFDDGPDPESTPAVLDRLHELGVPATFFVVARKALEQPDLVARARAEGHGIGDHSWDHRYGNFFRGRRAMIEWIKRSEDSLQALLGQAPAGFRPPAGVRTPELHWALAQLDVPLVLWNTRFYDTTLAWTPRRASRALRRIRPGSIILLHDRQSKERLHQFLETLEIFVTEAKRKNLEFAPLRRDILPHKERK